MAEVFKAKSYGVEGFEKIIAIKRILPTMGEDRDFIKMFIDEAKIAGQLAHANICQIFELGRIDGAHFIAMEYIWGKDLLQIQNRLRKVKQLMPIPMACFVIAKVLEGLDYAHRKRDPLGRPLEIVHRDCSPQNVLVSYEGEVKVIDFGIAKATSRNSRTMAGVLKGKFGYMSPEQVRGLPLDRRSDIFALGTMLFECLTGERLFQGETDFSTLEKVRNVDIPSPRSVNPAIPAAVEKVILKALAKDVDDRYQWCSEMLADLQQFLMSQDVVFTAKSLSGWVKQVFTAEIDRERQQLEQYKRIGRDGLIAGVPAAEAKLDVVEHLGEAGMPEGDATVLGGPDFSDIELAAGASPEVGPVPDSLPPPARASAAPVPAASRVLERGSADDFGEEAPTEIFGDEVDNTQTPTPISAGAGPSHAPVPSSAPSFGDRAGYQPARPVPVGAPMAGMAAAPASGPSDALAAIMAEDFSRPVSEPQAVPIQASPPYGSPAPAGDRPGVVHVDPRAAQGSAGGAPQRTVLGMQAPHIGGYPAQNFRPSQPPQQAPQYGYQQGYPSGPMQPPVTGPTSGQMPSQVPGRVSGPMSGPMPGHPSGPMAAQMPQGYNPAVTGQYGGPATAQPAPGEGRRSTLVRDILIGVAIAAVVLGGFLAVKLLVLDKRGGDGGAPSSGSMASLKLGMPDKIVADLFVDGKRMLQAVDNQQLIPLPAGKHDVKLVTKGGASCEETVNLEGGKTSTVKCPMLAPAGEASGSAAAADSGSAAGSDSAAGSGSAAGSAAGSGSATTAQGSNAGSAAQAGTTPTSGSTGTKPTSGTTGSTGSTGTKPTSGTTGTTGTTGTKPTSGTSGSTGRAGRAGRRGRSRRVARSPTRTRRTRIPSPTPSPPTRARRASSRCSASRRRASSSTASTPTCRRRSRGTR